MHVHAKASGILLLAGADVRWVEAQAVACSAQGWRIAGTAHSGPELASLALDSAADVLLVHGDLGLRPLGSAVQALRRGRPLGTVFQLAQVDPAWMRALHAVGPDQVLVEPVAPRQLAVSLALARTSAESRARRLQALTHEIAHDLNNQLSLVRGYEALARQATATLPAVQQDLEEIRGAVAVASTLVRRLLQSGAADADPAEEISPSLVPRQSQAVDPLAGRSGALPLKRALEGRTVLVVDDEPGIRQLLLRWLTPLADRILVASTGVQALRIAREEHIDLLVVDQGLPDLEGLELVDWLQNQHPQLEVLLISGSVPPVSNRPVLQKPFGVQELFDALANVYVGDSGSML